MKGDSLALYKQQRYFLNTFLKGCFYKANLENYFCALLFINENFLSYYLGQGGDLK